MTIDYKLLKPGLSFFSVKSIYDTDKSGGPLLSKNGHPMITVVLSVTDSEGTTSSVYDNISSQFQWKIEGIKNACAIKSEIYSSEIEAFNKDSLLGKSGYCSTVIHKSQLYPDKMAIANYLPRDFGEIIRENISPMPMNIHDKIAKDIEDNKINSELPPVSTYSNIEINDDEIPF